MARISIRDVAKKANVSISAVSLAYNKPYQLSQGTRDRIFSVADELGYRPQNSKKFNELKTVVLAIPSDFLLKRFVSSFSYAVIEQLAEHMYHTIILYYSSAEDCNHKLKSLLSKDSVSGMLVLLNDQTIKFKKTKLPTVYVNAWDVEDSVDVGLDFKNDLEEILHDFSKKGKKKIATLTTKSYAENNIIKQQLDHFQEQYNSFFQVEYDTNMFVILDESQHDKHSLTSFVSEQQPDVWFVIGEYAYNYLQYALDELLYGFAFVDEGVDRVRFDHNNLTILENPISQLVKLGVQKILNQIKNHESSSNAKSVLYTKKIY